MPGPKSEVTPTELAALLAAENPPLLLDVREPEELEISSLTGALNISMGELVRRLAELPKDRDMVVICRSGSRSGMVTEFLIGEGFPNVRNLTTGLNGWACDVDPTMRRY